jgi:hypothetical protein
MHRVERLSIREISRRTGLRAPGWPPRRHNEPRAARPIPALAHTLKTRCRSVTPIRGRARAKRRSVLAARGSGGGRTGPYDTAGSGAVSDPRRRGYVRVAARRCRPPCSPATLPDFHAGRSPRNKGIRYPADPPTTEEIVAVASTRRSRSPRPTSTRAAGRCWCAAARAAAAARWARTEIRFVSSRFGRRMAPRLPLQPEER